MPTLRLSWATPPIMRMAATTSAALPISDGAMSRVETTHPKQARDRPHGRAERQGQAVVEPGLAVALLDGGPFGLETDRSVVHATPIHRRLQQPVFALGAVRRLSVAREQA